MIKQLSGFHQVLVYKFDERGNGKVISEAISAGCNPYLGLHFPASDIPQQARNLYLKVKVRHIPDINYTPAKLISSTSDANNIDLSYSRLRSPSPIHVQYAKNMGVSATLVGSIVCDGKLWGLVTANHHNEALYIPPCLRDLFELICLHLSIQVSLAERLQAERKQRQLAQAHLDVISDIRRDGVSSIFGNSLSHKLAEIARADGFAIVRGPHTLGVGKIPDASNLIRLTEILNPHFNDGRLFSTNSLGEIIDSSSGENLISGCIVAKQYGLDNTFLCWFRSAIDRHIPWAGDPSQKASRTHEGTITPRTSFKEFIQTVSGQGIPWSKQEQTSVSEFITMLEIEIQRDNEREADIERQRLANIVEKTSDALVLLCNPNDKTPSFVNGKFTQITGYEANHFEIDERISIQNPTSDHTDFQKALLLSKQHGQWQGKIELRCKHQQTIMVNATISPIYDERNNIISFVTVARDITYEESLERKLLNESKMKSMGFMAAGIAHDFNNILNIILGYSEMVYLELPEFGSAQNNVNQVLSAVGRGRDLVAKLLEFSRQDPPQLATIDLSNVVCETIELIKPSISKDLDLQVHFDNSVLDIYADPVKIRQVVMNLCLNAIHAMDGCESQRLAIRLYTTSTGQIEHLLDTDFEEKLWVCVDIEDTGCGMPAETLEHIFDPFFSTKDVGEGTGLGLSVVHGIIGQHHGHISVKSTVGIGTTFTVSLPPAAPLN